MLQSFITYSVFFSLLPVVLLGFFTYKHLHGKFKGLFWFMCFSFFVQVYCFSVITDENRFFNNILYFFVPVEFIFYSVFFAKSLQGYIDKRVITVIAVLLVAYSVANTVFKQEMWYFNNWVHRLAGFFLASYSIAYFIKTLKEMRFKKLSDEPVIWINAAVFIYYLGNVIISLFGNILLYNDMYWLLYSFLIDAYSALIFVGFWKIYRNDYHREQIRNNLHGGRYPTGSSKKSNLLHKWALYTESA